MALQNHTDAAVLTRAARPRPPAGVASAPAPAASAERSGRSWHGAAQVVSHVASPPVLSALCVTAAAAIDGRPTAYLSAGLFTLVGVALPLFALLRQFRSGHVSDIEVTRRHERMWPLLLTTTCVGAGAILLMLLGSPPGVAGLAAILGVQSLALLVITSSWKISVHACAAGSAAALCWLLTGRPEPGLVLIGVMIWSRLQLRRHSPLQCLVGGGLGAALMAVLWPLLAG